jgi:hypothetical protein
MSIFHLDFNILFNTINVTNFAWIKYEKKNSISFMVNGIMKTQ